MLQLLHAGVIAIFRQFVAVFAIALILLSTELSGGGVNLSSAKVSLFAWSCVLVAVGLALTISQSTHLTAIVMLRASHFKRHAASKPALMMVVVQFGLAAILLSILAIRRPPHPIVVIAEMFGVGSSASLAWPALMSLGVAGFGATAYAGVKAIELSNHNGATNDRN
jgi:hypothetical protein